MYDTKKTLNEVRLIGCLGQDPEVKYTPSGAAVLTISVATTTAWKTQDGEKQEKTEWHRVVMWRKLAEIIGQYCKKGDRVLVSGRLETRSWNDKDGNKRYSTEIVADACQILSGKHTDDEAPEAGSLPRADAARKEHDPFTPPGEEFPAPPDGDDSVPF
jgi:single-strand DNA-binding protein